MRWNETFFDRFSSGPDWRTRGLFHKWFSHYYDAIMSAMASQITNLTIAYSSVYSEAGQRKHQRSASLAFVRGIHWWPVNSPHKGPLTRKCFHLMTSSCIEILCCSDMYKILILYHWLRIRIEVRAKQNFHRILNAMQKKNVREMGLTSTEHVPWYKTSSGCTKLEWFRFKMMFPNEGSRMLWTVIVTYVCAMRIVMLTPIYLKPLSLK